MTDWPSSDEPPGSIEQLLAAARAGLRRLSPSEAQVAMRGGAHLVDIRSDSRRATDGVIPGAHFVPRNVLEWRLDPACPHREPLLADSERRVVLICDDGFQSSLAAATLQRFRRGPVGDVIGGFRAWRAEGLPFQPRVERSTAMRAIECPCGHHLEGTDDEDLFRQAREHVDRDHPEMDRTDEQLRERVAADAYDAATVA